jgi:BMFP domain-containing protein YqiC
VGEFCAQTRAEIRKEFRDKDRELEAKIAQLERRLDALSQGKRERFTFAMRSSRS